MVPGKSECQLSLSETSTPNFQLPGLWSSNLHLGMSVRSSIPETWAESRCIFWGLLRDLQSRSAYQKVLLCPHEEHEAGAWLVLPQRLLQPLPGMHGVEGGAG